MIVFRLHILLSISLLKPCLFPPCIKTVSLLFHLLSFRSSISSCSSCRLFQMWSRCLLNCFSVLNVWDSLQIWPSYLLTPPPPSAFASLSFPALQRTIRKVRCPVAFLRSSACPPHIILSHFSHCFVFLIHFLSSVYCIRFIHMVQHCHSSLTLSKLNVVLHNVWIDLHFPPPAAVPCSLFNSTIPPCCPLRCFPNFRNLSRVAWLGPSLSFHSHQERRWDWQRCLLSTTITRRSNSRWMTWTYRLLDFSY